MASAARVVDADEAATLLREHYGLDAALTLLSAERDQNFHARASDGREFLLKLAHPSEPREFIRFQTLACRHIAQVDPALPVAALHATLDGELELLYGRGGEPERVVRLFTYLPGELLQRAVRSRAQRHALGRTLARLGLALRSYGGTAPDQRLLWDLQHGEQLQPLLAHIDDALQRALCERLFETIRSQALPRLAGLRRQVIHNDFQPWNVLVDAQHPQRVTGVIDFGDVVSAPLVCDVAVACAYHLEEPRHVLDGVCELLAGYQAEAPLERAELALLPDLMALRLVMTLAITSWRARLHPHNATYILRNAPLAWRGLTRLAALPREALLERLLP